MGKSKKAPVDRAVAGLRQSTRTDGRKVSVTRTITLAMEQSPDWGTALDVQAAAGHWKDEADALETNAGVIAGLRAQLKAAEAKQCAIRRDWQAAKVVTLSTITARCGGSADRVKAFNLDVLTRTRVGALDAPIDLAVNPGKESGEVGATWAKGLAGHGFLAQHAMDPAIPATISPTIACTKPRLTLGGLPPNANVSVRVAAIDPASPTGQSPWSAWVVGNAR